MKRPGKRIAADGNAQAFAIGPASFNRPGFDGITGVNAQRRFDGTREVVVELGGFKRVRFWRGLSGNVTMGFPFEIELLSSKVGRAGDGLFWIRLHLGFNFAVLEGAIERVTAEFANELVAVEFQLHVVVLVEVLEVRDPLTNRGLGLQAGRRRGTGQIA